MAPTIIGFGFCRGRRAHNGMMAYGNRTGCFELGRVYKQKSFQRLFSALFRFKNSFAENCGDRRWEEWRMAYWKL